jgi:transposase-like protein
MAIYFKGAHFPQEIILMGVRWYVAYPLSTRHVEELMRERGVRVDHATIKRWMIKYSPQLEEAFHRRKRPIWVSWRMDETYICVKGEWRYPYRAMDKYGETVDFLLTENRDQEAALRFLKKALRNAVMRPITPEWGLVEEVLSDALQEVLRQGQPRAAGRPALMVTSKRCDARMPTA